MLASNVCDKVFDNFLLPSTLRDYFVVFLLYGYRFGLMFAPLYEFSYIILQIILYALEKDRQYQILERKSVELSMLLRI